MILSVVQNLAFIVYFADLLSLEETSKLAVLFLAACYTARVRFYTARVPMSWSCKHHAVVSMPCERSSRGCTVRIRWYTDRVKTSQFQILPRFRPIPAK